MQNTLRQTVAMENEQHALVSRGLPAVAETNHRLARALNNQTTSSRHRYLILISIVTLYVLLALTYSLQTPAWEANDEYDHTLYVEYIVSHHEVPRISFVNGGESHQPPLYYLSTAVWQELLRIPHFPTMERPMFKPVIPSPPKPYPWVLHDYSSTQRVAAIHLHELRILSIVFGACTILFTFWAASIVTNRLSISAAAALFVALLPKEIIVSSVVTNDSLVIMLCSLALALILKWFSCSNRNQRLVIIGALGIALGAATITKFNSLTISVLYSAIILTLSVRSRNWREPLIFFSAFFLVSGWWLYHNLTLYGDVLAHKVSESYLKEAIPGLITPLPLSMVGKYFGSSAWYDGAANQLQLASWMNMSLAVLAAASLIGAVWYFFERSRKTSFPMSYARNRAISSILLLSAAAGLVSLLLISRETSQAEGRVTYVGLSAFAICATVGLANLLRVSVNIKKIGPWIWPVVFFILNVYIFFQFIYPLRGL